MSQQLVLTKSHIEQRIAQLSELYQQTMTQLIQTQNAVLQLQGELNAWHKMLKQVSENVSENLTDSTSQS